MAARLATSALVSTWPSAVYVRPTAMRECYIATGVIVTLRISAAAG